jgi:hypothetical protein
MLSYWILEMGDFCYLQEKIERRVNLSFFTHSAGTHRTPFEPFLLYKPVPTQLLLHSS